jgi:hypothetical protein
MHSEVQMESRGSPREVLRRGVRFYVCGCGSNKNDGADVRRFGARRTAVSILWSSSTTVSLEVC